MLCVGNLMCVFSATSLSDQCFVCSFRLFYDVVKTFTKSITYTDTCLLILNNAAVLCRSR
jgi:hypothetical protein